MAALQAKETRFIDIETVPDHPKINIRGDLAPSLAAAAPKTWNHNVMFGRVPIWSEAHLTADQIINVGNIWATNILTSNITAQTAIRGLKLALSLRSMTVGNNYNIFQQQARVNNPRENMLAAVPVPDINIFENIRYPTRAPVAPAGHNQLIPAEAPADIDAKKSVAYCFLAAYLMKLIVKSSNNVFLGLGNMRLRHMEFYGPSKTVKDFHPTLPQLTAYKDALIGQSMACNTFTHAIAYSHQNTYPNYNQQEMGVFNYLGALPFSYTGLHAYTLLLSLHVYSGTSVRDILKMVYCNVTSPAINCIVDILDKFERRAEHLDRDVTFKYCTLWAPQYFSAARSKNCPHLVYTLACARKVLGDIGLNADHNADPENIAAVGRISADLKVTLRSAGQILGNFLKRAKLSSKITSGRFNLAMQPPPAAPTLNQQNPDYNLEDLMEKMTRKKKFKMV